jgi:hypothetical protein
LIEALISSREEVVSSTLEACSPVPWERDWAVDETWPEAEVSASEPARTSAITEASFSTHRAHRLLQGADLVAARHGDPVAQVAGGDPPRRVEHVGDGGRDRPGRVDREADGDGEGEEDGDDGAAAAARVVGVLPVRGRLEVLPRVGDQGRPGGREALEGRVEIAAHRDEGLVPRPRLDLAQDGLVAAGRLREDPLHLVEVPPVGLVEPEGGELLLQRGRRGEEPVDVAGDLSDLAGVLGHEHPVDLPGDLHGVAGDVLRVVHLHDVAPRDLVDHVVHRRHPRDADPADRDEEGADDRERDPEACTDRKVLHVSFPPAADGRATGPPCT